MTQAMQSSETASSAAPPAAPRQQSDFEKLLEKDFVTPRMAENAAEMREFDQRMRKARVYAASDVVPMHYRQKENNCYIAIEIAERLHVSAMMTMQNTFIVQGKLGFQGQFAIAVINSSGIFAEPLEFEVQCDEPEGSPIDPSYRVRCFATRKNGKRAIRGPWVTWDMVKAEGWSSKAGSKWNSLADLMFRYRAAAFFGRTVCPELLMGFQTVEELEDVDGPDGSPIPTTPKLNGNGKRKSLADIPDSPSTPGESDGQPAGSPNTGGAIPTAPSAEIKAADAQGATASPASANVSAPKPSAAQTKAGSPKGSDAEGTQAAVATAAEARPAQSTPKRPRKIPSCNMCGAPLARDKCSNGGCESNKPIPQDVPAPEQDGATAEMQADAFASELPLQAVKDWMVKLPANVRDAAMEIAGITTMVDAAEQDVRNAAYNAKYYLLTNQKGK